MRQDHPVILGQHASLRKSGCAGRVLDVGQRVGPDADDIASLRAGRFQNRVEACAIRVFASGNENPVLRHMVSCAVQKHGQAIRIDNRERQTGIAGDIRHLVSGVTRVDRNMHGADFHHRQPGERVGQAIGHHQADPVADLYAHRKQGIADTVGLVGQFAVGDFLACLENIDGDRIAEMLGPVYQRANADIRHGSLDFRILFDKLLRQIHVAPIVRCLIIRVGQNFTKCQIIGFPSAG